MITLFTSSTCPLCRVVKKELEMRNLEFIELSIETTDGLGEFSFYFGDITQQIPALIEQKEDSVIFSAHGLEGIIEYLINRKGGKEDEKSD